MASITTRAGKGSPLTNAEVDANFTNLNAELATKQNSLGYTPANRAGDTFTGDVVINTKLAVGTSILANTNYRFGRGISGGVSSSAFVQNGNVQSDVTTTAVSFNSQANTAAASFTLTNYFHYYAQQGVIGAGSSITAITGFYADNTLSGATNTYGFRGAVGSGSGRWNLFMDGTASNFLAGNLIVNAPLGFGASGSPSYGTSGQFLKSGGSGSAPSWGSLTSGEVTTALGFTPYNSTNPSGYITDTGNARVGVENNGTLVGTRRNINFIPGAGISLSISDDAANEEVDITITSSAASGVTSFNTRTGAVTLTSGDVTGALGYTPLSNATSYLPLSGGTLTGGLAGTTLTMSGAVTLNGGTANGVAYLNGSKVLTTGSALTFDGSSLFANSYLEKRVDITANNIDLSQGNYFTKTIESAITLTTSPSFVNGRVVSFVLDLTNGGSAAITWWSNVKWPNGTAPTLTAVGRDVLGFFTHDGGATWTGLVLGKDVR